MAPPYPGERRAASRAGAHIVIGLPLYRLLTSIGHACALNRQRNEVAESEAMWRA